MSYSGRRQYWCQSGHYFVGSCWDDDPAGCPVCNEPLAFRNGVDDTNGEAYGFIRPVVTVPAVMCSCESCGNSHVAKPARYRIPTKKDRESA